MNTDSREYVHQSLNEIITAIGGYYILTKEVRQPFQEHELLYLCGYAVYDTTCCGDGGCNYAIVVGFVREWKVKRNSQGLDISLIEPICDLTLQGEIRQLVQKSEIISQVNFQLPPLLPLDEKSC